MIFDRSLRGFRYFYNIYFKLDFGCKEIDIGAREDMQGPAYLADGFTKTQNLDIPRVSYYKNIDKVYISSYYAISLPEGILKKIFAVFLLFYAIKLFMGK